MKELDAGQENQAELNSLSLSSPVLSSFFYSLSAPTIANPCFLKKA
jgi:hypothetical protein